MARTTKHIIIPIAVERGRCRVVGGLYIHGMLGGFGWTVTARSGFTATGRGSFTHRKAAERYARALAKLVDWTKHPKEKAAAFAWARRVSAKHQRALDRAWAAAQRYDAQLSRASGFPQVSP